MSPKLNFTIPKSHTGFYDNWVCPRMLNTSYSEKLLEEIDKDLLTVYEEDIDIHHTSLSDEIYVKDKSNPKWVKDSLLQNYGDLYDLKLVKESEELSFVLTRKKLKLVM
jgi:hypothetical protein